MIIEGILLGGTTFFGGLAGGIKASEMNEKSLKKYAKAFERNEEARQMIAEKETLLDKRLMNVAKKKRAIISISVPRFAEVYGKIQKLDIHITEEAPILFKNLPENRDRAVDGLVMSYQKPFTDSELVCGLANPFIGIGGMIVKDSERFASAARNQLSASNVIYSQAETICTAYDAIIARADRLSKLLAGLNFLFLKVIENTHEIIEKNGLNIRNYSDYDKAVLMTCVNFAAAIADVFHIPVVTKEGQLTEASVQAIECGENYLQKMQEVIND